MRKKMASERTARTAGAPRIAVLEDDPSQAKLVQHWLGSQGIACRVYDRGNDILRAVLRDTFDLVVLDWRVPHPSGGEVPRPTPQTAPHPPPAPLSPPPNPQHD